MGANQITMITSDFKMDVKNQSIYQMVGQWT